MKKIILLCFLVVSQSFAMQEWQAGNNHDYAGSWRQAALTVLVYAGQEAFKSFIISTIGYCQEEDCAAIIGSYWSDDCEVLDWLSTDNMTAIHNS